MNTKIGFVGGGNMASSLIGGLIKAGTTASQILVVEPDDKQRDWLSNTFSVEAMADNSGLQDCATVVLAVKPQIMKSVCQSIQANQETLYISIAAGIRTAELQSWLGATAGNGNELAIVRCMPNTPALLQSGASGLFANANTSAGQREQADAILSAVGIVAWVQQEQQIDAVTAVSGSGPAYYFLMMEAMQKAGESLGLPADTARQLVLQTALGAARMAAEGSDDPGVLREKVTSKGGTTAAALASFEQDNFADMVQRALDAANERAGTLADEMANS